MFMQTMPERNNLITVTTLQTLYASYYRWKVLMMRHNDI